MGQGLCGRGYLEQGQRRTHRVVGADEGGHIDQTHSAEGFFGLPVEHVIEGWLVVSSRATRAAVFSPSLKSSGISPLASALTAAYEMPALRAAAEWAYSS